MLELGTKGRYATRLVVYLALHGDRPIVKRSELAEAEGISLDYVEQLMLKLKAHGFVRSHRGAKGGYSIACDPEKTSVADVLEAMEGSISFVPCLENECSNCLRCVTRPVWKRAVEAFTDVVKSATIAELVAKAREINRRENHTYSI